MAGSIRMGRRRFQVLAVLVAVITLAITAACASTTANWRDPLGPPPASAVLSISHEADAKGISPADPVVVEVTGGTLTDVKVTNPDGKVVKGEYDETKTTWRTTEYLGYNKKYTIVASSVGEDGGVVEETRTFRTVKPDNYTLPYLRANGGDSRAENGHQSLLDGNTYGVGQPIVVWFDEPIKDKAAAEATLKVTTTPEVEGAWRWRDDREVHWRPKEYWPPGTKVTVEANVYGKHFGGGLYGQEDRKASFTIGRSKIAVADEDTKRMKVYIDGKLVTKINGKDVSDGIPISMGKGGTERGANGQIVDYTTKSGPHVITLKYEVYRMTSASYGITDPNSPNFYDERIKKSIRISGDGEFVHLADWNIWAHGKQNTSHGCINVGPDYIYWFYDNFGAGDIVEVVNTSKKLDWRNGLGDWVLSWEEWIADDDY
ncbi:MAG TPA: Ig-like domain-containing protein [Micromonosporaceae bacterium]|nr:Ig-like domain-containing protein [Micromonosporaceae bacterium]